MRRDLRTLNLAHPWQAPSGTIPKPSCHSGRVPLRRKDKLIHPMDHIACLTVAGLLGITCHCSAASLETSFGAGSALSEAVNPPVPNQTTAAPQPAAPEDSTAPRVFEARGVIRELPADGQTMVIEHQAIPGLMAKMTMEFTLRNTNELRGLRTGDEVTFRVKTTTEESWIEGLERAGGREAPRTPSLTVADLAHGAKLKVGELMPDAGLLGEDGRPVRLSDFRGRALTFTFIFTRCGLPDFCPRMSRRFSQARELLLELSPGPTNWQFLSISFDPEFDTPGVLARYADNYRGTSADRWLFAAAPTNVLGALTTQLDFRFVSDRGSLMHNLRTVVLDPQGRLYREFDGNQFKAEELAQAMAEATESKPR